MSTKILISIIVVNYNGKKYLKKLFDSISSQTFKHFEVIFVDNYSTDGSVEYLRKCVLNRIDSFHTKIITVNYNSGFAKGNNIGVAQARGKYIFFLNSDTVIEKDVLIRLHKTIKSRKFCAGVAPKIYLSAYGSSRMLDSVGICINHFCSPYNRGIGQLDLGQYDKEEDIVGICFAAALVNKELYLKTGGLDDSYFAYFEDVDWCIRAKKSGYSFFSSPKAVVHHVHSGTSSQKTYSWKYYHIFRNYLRTVTKSLGKKNTARIIAIKMRDFILSLLSKEYPVDIKRAIAKIILNYLFIDIYVYSIKRPFYHRHFIRDITDEYLFSYSQGETSAFFDPVLHKPVFSIMMIEHVVNRIQIINNKNKIIRRDWEMVKSTFLYSKKHSEKKVVLKSFLKKYSPSYYDKPSINYILTNLS